MKIIKNIIILCLGIMVGLFLGFSMATSPSSEVKCKEFKQVDWYSGYLRYTYIPELATCNRR